jgi:hypothetical protein
MPTHTKFSISHEFDVNNQWLGYEYIERISENHIRVLKYDSEGCLRSSRHIFEDAPTSGSVEDFITYMNSSKSIALNNNISRLEEERASLLIDLSTSVADAKLLMKKS